MADIATEAGISYGLLYHYFENKELVFQAAVERATTSGFQVLIKRIQALPLTPWECIYQFTEIVLDGILREPEGYLLFQQAITNSDDREGKPESGAVSDHTLHAHFTMLLSDEHLTYIEAQSQPFP